MSSELEAELRAVMKALDNLSDHAKAEEAITLLFAANRAWRELHNATNPTKPK